MTRLPGRLTFHSEPAGAAVFVDRHGAGAQRP